MKHIDLVSGRVRKHDDSAGGGGAGAAAGLAALGQVLAQGRRVGMGRGRRRQAEAARRLHPVRLPAIVTNVLTLSDCEIYHVTTTGLG